MDDPENILIAYASKSGATAEIAHHIAKSSQKLNVNITVMPIDQIHKLKDYDAVIIGASIRYDRWLSEATQFVTKHQNTLANMPNAMFFSCLALSRQNASNLKQANIYRQKIADIIPNLGILDIAGFGGVLKIKTIPLILRPLAHIAMRFIKLKQGDYRNWHQIETWTHKIIPQLTNQT